MEHVTGNESLTPEEFSALQEAKRMVSTRNNWTLEQHKWVDHACLVRFLRAKHLDVDAAMKMLDNTLQWRKSYLASITWPSVSQSASSSIITIMEDPSCCGRTVVLVNPLQANSMTDEQQLRLVLWTMEMALALPCAERHLIWLIDFEGTSPEGSAGASWTLLRSITKAMQEHYPDTLHMMLLWRPSAVMRSLYSMISSFLDPRVVKKIHIIVPLSEPGQNVALSPPDQAIIAAHFSPYSLPSHMTRKGIGRPSQDLQTDQYYCSLQFRLNAPSPQPARQLQTVARVLEGAAGADPVPLATGFQGNSSCCGSWCRCSIWGGCWLSRDCYPCSIGRCWGGIRFRGRLCSFAVQFKLSPESA